MREIAFETIYEYALGLLEGLCPRLCRLGLAEGHAVHAGDVHLAVPLHARVLVRCEEALLFQFVFKYYVEDPLVPANSHRLQLIVVPLLVKQAFYV